MSGLHGIFCYNGVMFTPEEKRERAREASRRWKDRNPEKAKAANRRKRIRKHDPQKSKAWRLARLEIPGYRERVNQQSNTRATKIRRWLDAYKLTSGCVDCGFNLHPAALHFDHVASGKTLNVCNSKSIAQAQSEITKCVVRCANCHAIKTWPHLLVRMSS